MFSFLCRWVVFFVVLNHGIFLSFSYDVVVAAFHHCEVIVSAHLDSRLHIRLQICHSVLFLVHNAIILGHTGFSHNILA